VRAEICCLRFAVLCAWLLHLHESSVEFEADNRPANYARLVEIISEPNRNAYERDKDSLAAHLSHHKVHNTVYFLFPQNRRHNFCHSSNWFCNHISHTGIKPQKTANRTSFHRLLLVFACPLLIRHSNDPDSAFDRAYDAFFHQMKIYTFGPFSYFKS
jgi:hypothetical protein